MHAYLVIAHNEPELLYKLLESLDYDDNDIYLHIDKNSDCFSEEQLLKACKKSNLYFAEREHVAWGGYSLINVELSLLEMAKKNGTYEYYHLVSGVDILVILYVIKGNVRHSQFITFQYVRCSLHQIETGCNHLCTLCSVLLCGVVSES